METIEEARMKLAELEGQVTTLVTERDAANVRLAELEPTVTQAHALGGRVAELEAALGESRTAVEGAATAIGEAKAGELAAVRRALLAEHAGTVVPELVAGDTAEALEASVTTAREAFDRAAEATRASTTTQQVPAGAGSARSASAAAVESLTPLGKITAGLAEQGRAR